MTAVASLAAAQQVNNVMADMDNINQIFQATQVPLQQILAKQGGQPHGPQLPHESVNREDPPAVAEIFTNSVPLVAIPEELELFTPEKFIKNGAKPLKGTTKPVKVEVWTFNILKTFRVMEVPGNHWVRLASYMLQEEAGFWWEAVQRINFRGYVVRLYYMGRMHGCVQQYLLFGTSL